MAAYDGLKPGESTIEDAEAHRMGDGRAEIIWWVVMPDGKAAKHFTRKRVPASVEERTPTGRVSHDWRAVTQELRASAERQARRILERCRDEQASAQGTRVWRETDSAVAYISKVSVPALMDNPDIRDSTRRRYRYLLKGVEELVGGMTIGDMLLPRTPKSLLKRAERLHGSTAAAGMASMLSQYVYGEMIVDRLIEQNPMLLPGNRFRSHGVNKGSSRRNQAQRDGAEEAGEVLVATPEQRARVVRWLLGQQPRKGHYGRLTAEQYEYQQRALADLTLVQATMGLRIGEALTLTAGHVGRDSDGLATVEVTPSHSKTRRGRVVGTFDPAFGRAVSERLLARCEGLGPGDYVFASPMARGLWNEANARKPLRRLYDELADACDAPVLRERFTHVWRGTLNTEYAQLYAEGRSGMDETTRTALFGHSAEVERKYYTAGISPEQQRARATRSALVIGDGPENFMRLVKGA